MRKRLAGFVVTLRGAGFAIGHAEVQDAARLLATPLAERPERLRAAMEALFSSRHSDLARFDELFDAFWRGRGVKRAMKITAEALASRSPRQFRSGARRRTISGRSRPRSPAAPLPKALRPRRRAQGRSVRARGDLRQGHRGVRAERGSAPKPRSSPNASPGACGRGSPAASARAGAAGGSTFARRSGSASPMAASRSSSNSAGARSSR